MQIQYTVGEYERYGTGCTRSFMIVHFRDGRESVFNVTKQADPLAHVAAELKSGKRGMLVGDLDDQYVWCFTRIPWKSAELDLDPR